MNQISYFISLIISFIGLYIGLALAYIAPEELKPGEKYLIVLQNFVLAVIILVFVYYIGNNVFLAIVISLITLLFLFYRKISTRAIYLLTYLPLLRRSR